VAQNKTCGEDRMVPKDGNKRIEIFCCYAHEDLDFLDELKKHLYLLERQKLITVWTNIDISPGTNWRKEIDQHLNTAQVILLLISVDFIKSEYCYSIEMQRAIERHETGEARVLPIIVRPVYWEGAPFSKFQVLPTKAVPITSRKWSPPDEAFVDVAKGIRRVVDELADRPQTDLFSPQRTSIISKDGFDVRLLLAGGVLLLLVLILNVAFVLVYQSHTYPQLKQVYKGTYDNPPQHMELSVKSQQAQDFTGTVSLSSSICFFTGHFTDNRHLTFTSECGGDTGNTFTGELAPDGHIEGTYPSSSGENVLWSVSPTGVTKSGSPTGPACTFTMAPIQTAQQTAITPQVLDQSSLTSTGAEVRRRSAQKEARGLRGTFSCPFPRKSE
jgi:TIR domain